MSAKLENVPALDGWVGLTEAAEILGISRQHSYKRARLGSEGKTGGYKTIRQIGTKPMYVVSVTELNESLQLREEVSKEE